MFGSPFNSDNRLSDNFTREAIGTDIKRFFPFDPYIRDDFAG